MKNGIKIVAALSIAFAGMLCTDVLVNQVAATTVVDCGCGKRACDGGCRLLHKRSRCVTCETQCGCVECPSCECDICQLDVKEIKVKKSCFKVEQKVICIPKVRLPWKKDCPPMTSKTKTINTLKKHTYECPSCEYKWSVVKPVEVPSEAKSTDTTPPTANEEAESVPVTPPVPTNETTMEYTEPVNPPSQEYQRLLKKHRISSRRQ